MKIIKLVINNFKGIKAVDITPDPDNPIVFINGPNGAGKSCVLDSLLVGFGGTSSSDKQLLRDGEVLGDVDIDIGDYKIRRVIKESSVKLQVKSKMGEIKRSPQAVLKSLMGPFAVDPMGFFDLGSKQQVEMLSGQEGSKASHGLMARKEVIKEDLRRLRSDLKVNKSMRDMIGDYKEYANPPNIKPEAFKFELKEAMEYNDKTASMKRQFDETTHEIERLARKAADLEIALKDRVAIDIEEIMERMDEAKAEIEEYQKSVKAEAMINEGFQIEQSIEELKHEDKVIDASLADMCKEWLPGVDLSLSPEGAIQVNGINARQISTFEKMDLAMKISIHSNPQLRVMMIKDGSLIDGFSMKNVRDFAKDNEFQVWIECVSNEPTGEGFYIVDGSL